MATFSERMPPPTGVPSGPLMRHDEVAQRGQRLVGKARAVELVGLVAREHLDPGDLALAAVGLLDRGIHHFEHHRRDVDADAVAFDEGDDGIVRNVERRVRIDGDALAVFRNLDVFVLHVPKIVAISVPGRDGRSASPSRAPARS